MRGSLDCEPGSKKFTNLLLDGKKEVCIMRTSSLLKAVTDL